MNEIVRRIWLSFWRLIPANPILVRVVQGASRRKRHLWMRSAYLAALLIVVIGSLFPAMGTQEASLTELAKGASQTFGLASWVQLAMMCLLAPIFTAAAITQERDAQTFNILLSTPLTNAQIVFGSLMSRLYFVMLLLLAGLPIFLATMVYGGVTQTQVLESFALSGATAALTGALAILIAMLGVGTRRTIFSFYLGIALYLVAGYVAGQWPRTWVDVAPANLDGQKMSLLAPLHPFLALDVALNRIQAPPESYLVGRSSWLRLALAHPSYAYVLWTSLTAFVFTVIAVLFVRRGAKLGEPTLATRILAVLRIGRRDRLTRKPRRVWVNPVAWREAKTRGQSGPFRWALILGGLVASTLLLIYYLASELSAAEVRQWLVGLIMVQFSIALLIATNTAATSMTKERESKTMDILLTTPVTSKFILWGKLRGLVSFAAPLIGGPIVVLFVFGTVGLFRDDSPPAVWMEASLELGLLMLMFTAAACVIALRISLLSKKNVTAVMYSVGLMILLFGAASLIGFAIAENAGGSGGGFCAAFTPFTAVWYLINPVDLFGHPKGYAEHAAGLRGAVAFGTALSVLIYMFVVYTMYMGLVRNFDMIVRKQSGT
ncbi:MAG: ABC transporter permease [Phycisphaerae bacterium]